jgi:hypothetical protein
MFRPRINNRQPGEDVFVARTYFFSVELDGVTIYSHTFYGVPDGLHIAMRHLQVLQHILIEIQQVLETI